MGPPVINRVGSCLKVFWKKIKSSKMGDVDKEEILRICDIYDWHGKGELDMYYFMDIFYALGMNLTKKTTVKFGQTDDVEKAYKKFDEVVALVQQAVKEPEHTGNYFDYVELCKLYDKNENGTMMLAELETFLSLMGVSTAFGFNSLSERTKKRTSYPGINLEIYKTIRNIYLMLRISRICCAWK